MRRKKLAHLDRTEHPRGAEHRGGRALDGGQRRAQLVAHQAEELRAHAFELLERRQILQGDDHRDHRAVLAMDRGCVDQRGDAAPVGDREHDLLGAHRLGAAQARRQRQLVQRDLAPVRAPAGHHFQELLRGVARGAQALHDPRRLAVERDQLTGPRIEHHDADRGGLDERLEVGPCPLLGAVRARVGDGARRLRGEQPQHLLVRAGERLAAFLAGEEEAADMHGAMAHRRAEERLPGQTVRGEAERLHVGAHVGEADRSGQVAKALEQARPVGPLLEQAVRLGGDPGAREVAGRARLVDGRDDAVARAGQRPGAVEDFAQHGLEVEARGDVTDGRAQPRDALVQGRDLAPGVVELGHCSPLPCPRGDPRTPAGPGGAGAGRADADDIETVTPAPPWGWDKSPQDHPWGDTVRTVRTVCGAVRAAWPRGRAQPAGGRDRRACARVRVPTITDGLWALRRARARRCRDCGEVTQQSSKSTHYSHTSHSKGYKFRVTSRPMRAAWPGRAVSAGRTLEQSQMDVTTGWPLVRAHVRIKRRASSVERRASSVERRAHECVRWAGALLGEPALCVP